MEFPTNVHTPGGLHPEGDTLACTKEACAFRDEYTEFRERDAVALGVSVELLKSRERFVKKLSLPFSLLSGEDRRIVEAYGVWGEKSFMGRTYQGTDRVVFLIGPDVRIKKIWPKVKPGRACRRSPGCVGCTTP